MKNRENIPQILLKTTDSRARLEEEITNEKYTKLEEEAMPVDKLVHGGEFVRAIQQLRLEKDKANGVTSSYASLNSDEEHTILIRDTTNQQVAPKDSYYDWAIMGLNYAIAAKKLANYHGEVFYKRGEESLSQRAADFLINIKESSDPEIDFQRFAYSLVRSLEKKLNFLSQKEIEEQLADVLHFCNFEHPIMSLVTKDKEKKNIAISTNKKITPALRKQYETLKELVRLERMKKDENYKKEFKKKLEDANKIPWYTKHNASRHIQYLIRFHAKDILEGKTIPTNLRKYFPNDLSRVAPNTEITSYNEKIGKNPDKQRPLYRNPRFWLALGGLVLGAGLCATGIGALAGSAIAITSVTTLTGAAALSTAVLSAGITAGVTTLAGSIYNFIKAQKENRFFKRTRNVAHTKKLNSPAKEAKKDEKEKKEKEEAMITLSCPPAYFLAQCAKISKKEKEALTPLLAKLEKPVVYTDEMINTVCMMNDTFVDFPRKQWKLAEKGAVSFQLSSQENNNLNNEEKREEYTKELCQKIPGLKPDEAKALLAASCTIEDQRLQGGALNTGSTTLGIFLFQQQGVQIRLLGTSTISRNQEGVLIIENSLTPETCTLLDNNDRHREIQRPLKYSETYTLKKNADNHWELTLQPQNNLQIHPKVLAHLVQQASKKLPQKTFTDEDLFVFIPCLIDESFTKAFQKNLSKIAPKEYETLIDFIQKCHGENPPQHIQHLLKEIKAKKNPPKAPPTRLQTVRSEQPPVRFAEDLMSTPEPKKIVNINNGLQNLLETPDSRAQLRDSIIEEEYTRLPDEKPVNSLVAKGEFIKAIQQLRLEKDKKDGINSFYANPIGHPEHVILIRDATEQKRAPADTYHNWAIMGLNYASAAKKLCEAYPYDEAEFKRLAPKFKSALHAQTITFLRTIEKSQNPERDFQQFVNGLIPLLQRALPSLTEKQIKQQLADIRDFENFEHPTMSVATKIKLSSGDEKNNSESSRTIFQIDIPVTGKMPSALQNEYQLLKDFDVSNTRLEAGEDVMDQQEKLRKKTDKIAWYTHQPSHIQYQIRKHAKDVIAGKIIPTQLRKYFPGLRNGGQEFLVDEQSKEIIQEHYHSGTPGHLLGDTAANQTATTQSLEQLSSLTQARHLLALTLLSPGNPFAEDAVLVKQVEVATAENNETFLQGFHTCNIPLNAVRRFESNRMAGAEWLYETAKEQLKNSVDKPLTNTPAITTLQTIIKEYEALRSGSDFRDPENKNLQLVSVVTRMAHAVNKVHRENNPKEKYDFVAVAISCQSGKDRVGLSRLQIMLDALKRYTQTASSTHLEKTIVYAQQIGLQAGLAGGTLGAGELKKDTIGALPARMSQYIKNLFKKTASYNKGLPKKPKRTVRLAAPPAALQLIQPPHQSQAKIHAQEAALEQKPSPKAASLKNG